MNNVEILSHQTKHINNEWKKYDKVVKPRFFSEGELVLVYNQDKEPLAACKFKYMWLGPYIVSKVINKHVYELVDYDGNKLSKPWNGIYLKKYYSYELCFSCMIIVKFCKWSLVVSVSYVV